LGTAKEDAHKQNSQKSKINNLRVAFRFKKTHCLVNGHILQNIGKCRDYPTL
jgi:hypothetical protein